MKKIAIVCNYILKPDRVGGMDRFFKRFDEELRKKGCQVDWFFTGYTPFEFYETFNLFSAQNGSVENFFLTHPNSCSYNIVITHFTELCTKFYKDVKQQHKKAYVVAVDHNPRPLEGFSMKKKIKKRIEGLLYGKYINQFIGVSQYTANYILKDYGSFLKNKTVVVHNGIDMTVFKRRSEDNKNKFIVASHLRPSKGIQDLLKALSSIDVKLLKEVQVDIYGEGFYKQELINLKNQYGLDEVVSFKGSSSKLHELFFNYSYMIQPTYMECFSLSILESLSANVPVITTAVGGNLEVIKDEVNGFVYSPGNTKELAKIVTAVLQGKKVKEEEVYSRITNHFYLEKMVQEHITLLPCI